ncbi:hypothetical protein DWY69_06890 [Eisenbergiella massiliensis]|uniref:Uncharacterized protein n=1 Tax=Eisenbergiella massiliensis TaxID=1720294 RepID=A0A3E3IZW3_9FIRM|nr:hypothetical protein DWY69_06890 [Eisenbergiella massiliensis]
MSPLAPCGPVAPFAPVSPFGPCGPVAPISPLGPCGPSIFSIWSIFSSRFIPSGNKMLDAEDNTSTSSRTSSVSASKICIRTFVNSLTFASPFYNFSSKIRTDFYSIICR